jgi:hypothetical protein
LPTRLAAWLTALHRSAPFHISTRRLSAAAAGTFGNLGRDALYGPGFGSVDFPVFKETAITERFKVQFRAEIFNLFDRANLANPGTMSTQRRRSG